MKSALWLLATPALLLGILLYREPALFLYLLALAALITIGGLALALISTLDRVAGLEDELDRRGREGGAEPLVVDVTDAATMDQLLAELTGDDSGIPEQRRPGTGS